MSGTKTDELIERALSHMGLADPQEVLNDCHALARELQAVRSLPSPGWNEAVEACASRLDAIIALLQVGERGFIMQGNGVMKQLTQARIDAVEEALKAVRELALQNIKDSGNG